MTDITRNIKANPRSKSVFKKLLWALLSIAVLLVFVVIALRIFITTAGGHRFIENQVNSRSFGAIDSVKISGLSGDPLGDARLKNLEIKDKDGVWMSAENINLKYAPMALLSRHVNLQKLNAEKIDVLRAPNLNQAAPSDSSEKSFKISAPDVTINALSLSEALIGQAAVFGVDAGTVLTRDEKILKLNVARLDSPGDKITLNISQSRTRDITGMFKLSGVADGPIADLLRAPSGEAVSGTGELRGTQTAGEGEAKVNFGDAEAVTVTAKWTAQTLNIESRANLLSWAQLTQYERLLGKSVTANAQLIRETSPRSFTVGIESQHSNITAKGSLPNEGFDVQRADIKLRVDSPMAAINLPEGYGVGAVNIAGSVDISTGQAFSGRVSAANVKTPFGAAGKIDGPVNFSKSEAGPLVFAVNLKASGLKTDADLPIVVGTSAKLNAQGAYSFETKKLSLKNADITSGETGVTASGALGVEPQIFDLRGTVKAGVSEQGQMPPGLLEAEYTVIQTAQSAPALTTTGRFVPSQGLAAPLSDLIGKQLAFETRMEPVEGGVKITDARILGANISAAMGGDITDTLNISAQARTRTAFSYSGVDIGDSADLTMRLTGTRADPNIRVQAEAASLTAGGQTATDLTAKAEVRDILSAPKGPVEITANTEYGALLAGAQFASAQGNLTMADINVTLGEVSASGDVIYYPSGLLDGELKLNLPEQSERFARASLSLKPGDGDIQNISFDVEAKNAALADFEIDSLSAKASGTFDALSGDIAFEGRRNIDILARPISITGPFELSRKTPDLLKLTASPQGRYGAITFASRAPLSLEYADAALRLKAPMSLAEKPVDLIYERSENGDELVKLTAQHLPISILTLPGNLADSRGLWDADIDLTASGGAPAGTAQITITDWRGFGVEAQTGLTVKAQADITGAGANMVLTGRASTGFDIDGKLILPLLPGTSLLALRPNMDMAMRGDLSANGPAQSILGLITPPNADLGGQLNMSVQIAGTAGAPEVTGKASGNGLQFEALDLGTQIKNGSFNAQFDNETLNVPSVSFTDAKDGVVDGSGKFILGEFGRPIGSLSVSTKKFNVVDRRDVSARISGNIKYESLAKSAAVSGNITVGEAQIKQIQGGGVSVVEIDVQEINAPEDIVPKEAKAPAIPTGLDIKIKAPRRIFIRSRGLDVELSADLNIGGTLSNPAIKGRADVERGGYKIAGKELAFETGSITFDGPVRAARVALKAVADTTNIKASVDISGTVENPEISLSSSPDRPDDEILSALLFGRSATELSAIEAAQLAGALAQFSGNGAGFDLLGGVRESLGIGQLSVGVSEDGTAQIKGGRYLAKNVYLQVFSGAGTDATGAIIDWELRKNISLQSKIQADNEQSLSLRYKYDF